MISAENVLELRKKADEINAAFLILSQLSLQRIRMEDPQGNCEIPEFL